MTDRSILFKAPMIQALLAGTKTQHRMMLKNIRPDWRLEAFSDLDALFDSGTAFKICCIPCHAGDRLWCRETFVLENTRDYHDEELRPTDRPYREFLIPDDGTYFLIPHYRATEPEPYICDDDNGTKWTASTQMPRWASRLTLVITDVRVQKLQDISEADAMAEGCRAQSYSWWQGFVRDKDGGRVPAETGNADEPPPEDFENPEIQHYSRSAKEQYAERWNSTAKRGFMWDDNPWVAACSFTVHQCNIDEMPRA